MLKESSRDGGGGGGSSASLTPPWSSSLLRLVAVAVASPLPPAPLVAGGLGLRAGSGSSSLWAGPRPWRAVSLRFFSFYI